MGDAEADNFVRCTTKLLGICNCYEGPTFCLLLVVVVVVVVFADGDDVVTVKMERRVGAGRA